MERSLISLLSGVVLLSLIASLIAVLNYANSLLIDSWCDELLDGLEGISDLERKLNLDLSGMRPEVPITCSMRP